MAISTRLRAVIRWRGVSQKQLAADAGIPFPAFRKYLDGKSAPGASHLKHLMRARVDIGWLLTGRNSGPLCDWLPDLECDFAALGDNRFLGALFEMWVREHDTIHAADLRAGRPTPDFTMTRHIGRRFFVRALLVAETFESTLRDLAAQGHPPEYIADKVAASLTGEGSHSLQADAAGAQATRETSAPVSLGGADSDVDLNIAALGSDASDP